MTEQLDTVKENIKICEDIQKEDPLYYEKHWVDIHETLLQVKEDLEEMKKL